MEKRCLTAYRLKWIAVVLMVLDHAYKIFLPQIVGAMSRVLPLKEEWCYTVLMLFCGVTTMAFYLFAFFCAESCRYTRHRARYLRNLFLFALLSEIPFQLMIAILSGEPVVPHLGFSNVLVTLFLGAAACFGYDELARRGWKRAAFLPALLCAGCAWALQTDYGFYGVAAVFVCYLLRGEGQRLLALGAVAFLRSGVECCVTDILAYGFNWYMVPVYLALAAYGLCAPLLLRSYRGERGRGMKYFFYFFYPAHISLLVALYLWVAA